jgi:hypothetical protein
MRKTTKILGQNIRRFDRGSNGILSDHDTLFPETLVSIYMLNEVHISCLRSFWGRIIRHWRKSLRHQLLDYILNTRRRPKSPHGPAHWRQKNSFMSDCRSKVQHIKAKYQKGLKRYCTNNSLLKRPQIVLFWSLPHGLMWESPELSLAAWDFHVAEWLSVCKGDTEWCVVYGPEMGNFLPAPQETSGSNKTDSRCSGRADSDTSAVIVMD